jgi:hypothetical protein
MGWIPLFLPGELEVDGDVSCLEFREAGRGGGTGEGLDFNLGGTGGGGELSSSFAVPVVADAKLQEFLGITGSFQLKVIGGSRLLGSTSWL